MGSSIAVSSGDNKWQVATPRSKLTEVPEGSTGERLTPLVAHSSILLGAVGDGRLVEDCWWIVCHCL